MTSKPNLFRVSLSVALVALLLSLLCAPIAALADGLQDHVYVYAITDFHGHVEQGGEVAGMLDEVPGEASAEQLFLRRCRRGLAPWERLPGKVSH